MPDAFHVLLLGANAAGLCLTAVFLTRARRHALRAADHATSAQRRAADARDMADRAGDEADRAEQQANRAARKATRAINANDALARAVTLDAEPDVIPFTRPAPTGPRLANLDEPA